MSESAANLARGRASLEKTAPIVIARIPFDAPWGWLAAGWRDVWAAPHISLLYGAAFSLAAYVFVFHLSEISALPLLLPLAGGFLLIGPLLAVGLYEISRRRALGEPIRFGEILLAGRGARGQLAFFGVMLLILYFAWLRIAFLLFMLFFGPVPFPPVSEFIPTLLFTQHGLGLLVTGTAIGAMLAAIAYSISAISVPMLLDRKVDTITAIISSVRAVLKNPAAMAFWAVLIVALVGFGVATLFLGLIVVFPLVGHATWHAYRDIAGQAG